jgi:hypothetical protein
MATLLSARHVLVVSTFPLASNRHTTCDSLAAHYDQRVILFCEVHC